MLIINPLALNEYKIDFISNALKFWQPKPMFINIVIFLTETWTQSKEQSTSLPTDFCMKLYLKQCEGMDMPVLSFFNSDAHLKGRYLKKKVD